MSAESVSDDAVSAEPVTATSESLAPVSDGPLADPDPDPDADAVEDEDEDEDAPWTVAVCPVTPELAARIAGMVELDWEDPELTEKAVLDAGWRSTGAHYGDFNEKAYTPAGHLVYGDDRLAMPFAYEYWIHPDGVWTEDFWADQPGWHSLVDPPAGTFDAQLDAVADLFTELLGPPDHDVTHRRRPGFDYHWRYRIWRRGDNVLVVAPGLDGFSYSQFEHAFVQIRPLPADAPLPPAAELPDFLTW
ncbi:hypothetical protein AB0D10_01825 [Kitasatospora sp. NPDC048545]|uniref:hypothetical protein n=1 Tax=Kitasatospora sp. NPDC048545 TaxID=3157208 RepID=UPI0033D9BBAF